MHVNEVLCEYFLSKLRDKIPFVTTLKKERSYSWGKPLIGAYVVLFFVDTICD